MLQTGCLRKGVWLKGTQIGGGGHVVGQTLGPEVLEDTAERRTRAQRPGRCLGAKLGNFISNLRCSWVDGICEGAQVWGKPEALF